ncbi:hypothetical protein MMIC_P0517 [Mariprofundus micogutta]|uniref:Uncharacterized protein n=1 Tax=Mariprofundus micogutta TaxID=1921010 RepID=A0A1L8CKY4_9PROT|nr:hypothetical protein [Mariprofundus micogutta]GAV19570.1 hypothetical protein MMIC_P0517 [Mariprofundus micogutta]
MKEYYSSFRWAVPVAFSDAVNLCRFEEGDVFYDSPLAYGDCWKEAGDKIGFSLQVRYPARSSTAVKGAGAVFEKNWSSEVRIDLYENLTLTKSITTTQGKLYTALWKNDLKVLESKETLAMPIRLKHIMKLLKKAPKELSNYSKNHLTFVLPRDMANPVSKAKYQKIKAALAECLEGDPIILSPSEAGIINCADIAPTLDVALFKVNLNSEEKLIDLIKSAVYAPSKNAKISMFRLASHGFVV